jgi:hypothetical protein
MENIRLSATLDDQRLPREPFPDRKKRSIPCRNKKLYSKCKMIYNGHILSSVLIAGLVHFPFESCLAYTKQLDILRTLHAHTEKCTLTTTNAQSDQCLQSSTASPSRVRYLRASNQKEKAHAHKITP